MSKQRKQSAKPSNKGSIRIIGGLHRGEIAGSVMLRACVRASYFCAILLLSICTVEQSPVV